MVSQCVENNRTDPLTCSCRWMHEGADLRSYVGGCVRSGTAHQKHKATCFARAFSALTDMRSEKHSHLAYCSWLTSNNDAFSRILDGTHEIWCAHIKNTRIHRQYRCFWFLLALYVELHFLTLWSTCRTCSWSKHESLCTSLRNHVMSTHSDPTPGCPDHFTTPHSHFHLFLPPLRTKRKEPVRAQIWKKLAFYNTKQTDRPQNKWWNKHYSGMFICFLPTVSPQPYKADF